MTTPQDAFALEGRAWLRSVIPPQELDLFRSLLSQDQSPGARPGPEEPLAEAIRRSTATAAIRAVWPGMRPVRIVTFDKAQTNNWSVPWHQDRVIAVSNRIELPGYKAWSRKGDVWHCEPPLSVLNEMLFVRIYLDPVCSEAGSMEFVPGTHSFGRIGSAEAAEIAEKSGSETENAAAGDVLVLPMLTLHRSGQSRTAGQRRVIRVDYADFDLPTPLSWNL